MNRLSTVIEVDSWNPITIPCFFCVCLSILYFYQFIDLFKDIIHYHFQTIWVAEYRFNDSKQCMPYLVDAFSGISHLRFLCLIMSNLMGTLYKC